MFWAGLIIGAVFGGSLGFVVAVLCITSKDDNDMQY